MSRPQLTFVPSLEIPGAGHFHLFGVVDLAAAASTLGLPPGEHATETLRLPADYGRDGHSATEPAPMEDRVVAGMRSPVLPMTRALAELPLDPANAGHLPLGDSIRAWSLAAKLALEFVTQGRVVPVLRTGTRAGTAVAHWRAWIPSDGRIEQLAQAMPWVGHAVLSGERAWDPAELLVAYADALADVCARNGTRPKTTGEGRTPRRPLIESLQHALGGIDPVIGNLRDRPAELEATVQDWSAPALRRLSVTRARLQLELQEPSEADRDKPTATWQVAFQLRSPNGQVATASDVWACPNASLDVGGDSALSRPQESMARDLAAAARLFPPLARAAGMRRPTAFELSIDEVAQLLDTGVGALESMGVKTALPVELDPSRHAALRLRARIGEPELDEAQLVADGDRVRDGLGGQGQLTSFTYEIALGDETISQQEFDEIVALKRPIVRWRDKWIRVDEAELEQIAARAGTVETVGFADGLAAALGGWMEDGDQRIQTVVAGQARTFLERLRMAEPPEEPDLVGVKADLRPYQKRGVAWLQALEGLGMGAVLADEMGLGKTLQALALITSRKQDRPSLVVCPTSVVGNWERESGKFTPSLNVVRHHGPERTQTAGPFAPGTLVVTSYALLRRDIELLNQVAWDVVVFDEAQQIKNRASKAARAARDLTARMRVAMTGTPVENRLSELWSVIDVTNPGLLGKQSTFTKRFAVPIERWRDEERAEQLRKVIAPFVLRRRKNDPDVLLDIPPKTEVTTSVHLTKEQATLYRAAVDETFDHGLGDSAMARRGRILRLVTALKQICNHPAHYLGEPGPIEGRSGKLDRATDILAEVVDNGDRALVFTQYRVMGDLLVDHFGKHLPVSEVPFLHGGVTLPNRDEMVRRFQEDADGPPIFIVSLRAGGTGLNLTRATEVVHFDRWWNPAVEDQATDRVHRIGQDQAVTVHRLVAAGTVEERIADLLEQKRDLADRVVGSGESWLTEMGDDELHELVSLAAGALLDDEDAAGQDAA